MMKLVYLPRARNDLNSIAQFIYQQTGDRHTAIRFVKKLQDKCATLAQLSFRMGTSRLELGEAIRSTVVENYVILFQYRVKMVEIIMVTEGHRDIEALFESGE